MDGGERDAEKREGMPLDQAEKGPASDMDEKTRQRHAE